MIRILLLSLVSLIELSNMGCARAPAENESRETTRTIREPVTGTTLETSVERAEYSVADRIWVTTSWHWTDDVNATLEDPDWSADDWSVIETIHSEPLREQQGYTALRRVLLEPFLPGEYTIPTGILLVESPELGEPVELMLEKPITVRVVGVLPDTATGVLNPLAEPAVPPVAETESDALMLWVLFAAVGIAAGGIVFYLRTRDESGPPHSVHDQLIMIRDARDLQRDHAFQLLERVFERLDPRLRKTTEFAGMIRACEQARYAPESDTHANPSRLAAFTLELLGHDQRRDSLEGVNE